MPDFFDPLLRILSECGVIEELTIRNGNLRADKNDFPLTFEKLTKLHLASKSYGISAKFFSIFTQAHTPELRELYYISNRYDSMQLRSIEVVNFIRSKNSLRSFDINLLRATFTDVRQIIDILKSGGRPFLNLNIWSFDFDSINEKEVIINERPMRYEIILNMIFLLFCSGKS